MKKTTTYFPLLFCWLLVVLFSSAGAQVQNVGRIISYKKTAGGIEGKTASALFAIEAFSEHIIRVRISKKQRLDHFSYALAGTLGPASPLAVSDRGKTVELSTAVLTVVVEKEPSLRVIFKNKSGAVINEDVAGAGFGTTFIGDKVSSYKVLQEGERFVGLGEVLGNLDKRGSAHTLNNTDNYRYGDPRIPMYSSIPFFIGLHNGLVYGLFYHNTHKTFFNFGSSTPFTSINAEGGDADYFLIHDTSVAKVLEHYTALTGRMPLPPRWSLGYHHSRCCYYPQENVQILAETFRRKKIPVDCIVLDAEYLQDYEPFRINKERFPDLPALARNLKKLDIELTASVNPGIKIDSSYFAYHDGLKQDVFVKYSNGDLFVSEIAPSTNHFVDFTNPRARQWWSNHMKFLPDNGIHGFWNDMNEPAVAGSHLPDNLLFDFDGRKANALEAKNVYGFQMARSSYEAALKWAKDRRPFILTRSAFAGVQRYSALWSGDNTASNEGLLSGVLLNSQLGLSGVSFVGPDVGGYIGDGSKDLFRRWLQVGVFSPFLRNHKEFYATANEPWSYGEEVEALSQTYIGFRYRLMPYVYSKFFEAAQTGLPVARSLCINYPFTGKVYDPAYQYQFLFGDALLVVPVTAQEKAKKIFLPEGQWYNLFTGELHTGEKEFFQEVPSYQIPVFVKASSIIPMQTLVQSTKEKPSDTLFLHLFNGRDENHFVYYEDAGDGFAYQQGAYCKRTISYKPAEKSIRLSKQEGSFASVFKKIQLVLHGFGDAVKEVAVNSTRLQAVNTPVKILDGLEHVWAYYDKNYVKSLREAEPVFNQKTIVVDNSANDITILLP